MASAVAKVKYASWPAGRWMDRFINYRELLKTMIERLISKTSLKAGMVFICYGLHAGPSGGSGEWLQYL